MTLILGLRTPSRIQVLSDTRITHPDVTQIEEVPGRLKLLTVSPFLCVGYAGAATRAIDVLRSIAAIPSVDAPAAIGVLERESRDGDIDFLLASCGSELRLIKVTNGQAIEWPRECFIGDPNGAAEYKSRKASQAMPELPDPEDDNMARAIMAFREVVRDRAVPTVAGLSIRIGSRPDGFRYLAEAAAYMPSQVIPSGVPTPLHFGGSAEGGFAYSLLVPVEPGVPVLAVHFYQGRLAFVYAPWRQDLPFKVTDVSHAELKAHVRAAFDCDVDGVGLG